MTAADLPELLDLLALAEAHEREHARKAWYGAPLRKLEAHDAEPTDDRMLDDPLDAPAGDEVHEQNAAALGRMARLALDTARHHADRADDERDESDRDVQRNTARDHHREDDVDDAALAKLRRDVDGGSIGARLQLAALGAAAVAKCLKAPRCGAPGAR